MASERDTAGEPEDGGGDIVDTYQKENRFGIPKTYLKVQIGTTILDVPKTVKSPVTGKMQDLTRLSEDGSHLKFLATWAYFNRADAVNLSDSPIITLDKEKWDVEETESHVFAINSEVGGDDE